MFLPRRAGGGSPDRVADDEMRVGVPAGPHHASRPVSEIADQTGPHTPPRGPGRRAGPTSSYHTLSTSRHYPRHTANLLQSQQLPLASPGCPGRPSRCAVKRCPAMVQPHQCIEGRCREATAVTRSSVSVKVSVPAGASRRRSRLRRSSRRSPVPAKSWSHVGWCGRRLCPAPSRGQGRSCRAELPATELSDVTGK